MRENPAIFEALDVSNPLRVEGDCRIPSWSRRKIQFLIHYGWRGTKHEHPELSEALKVSNPLRLEGDGSYPDILRGVHLVSNPLRIL